MRNVRPAEWSKLADVAHKLPVYAIIRHKLSERLEILKGVIKARPLAVDYVVFESKSETWNIDKKDILIDDVWIPAEYDEPPAIAEKHENK